MAFLFENQTTNGTSSDMEMTAGSTIYATGAFDGASVAILIAAPDGDFVKLTEWRPGVGLITAPDSLVVQPIGSYELRAVLANAGAATDVSIEVIEA